MAEDEDGELGIWARRSNALTHIVTHPTFTPSLHSQLFVAAQLPSYVRWDWDYPPLLRRRRTPALLDFRWSLALFLRRAARLARPISSWRSKCPFQQPPPLVLSSAVDPPPTRLGAEERREYVRNRLRRGRIGVRVPWLLAFAVPNLAMLSLLLLDPFWYSPESWTKP